MATCPRTHRHTHTHPHTNKPPTAGLKLVGHTSITHLYAILGACTDYVERHPYVEEDAPCADQDNVTVVRGKQIEYLGLDGHCWLSRLRKKQLWNRENSLCIHNASEDSPFHLCCKDNFLNGREGIIILIII